MLLNVRLFARLREIAGAAEVQLVVGDPATVADAWTALIARHPGMANYGSSVSCAVNEDYARMTTALRDGDEVAFLPPVSGG